VAVRDVHKAADLADRGVQLRYGIRTGYLSRRNARSDMAVSRQVTTPSITGRDAAFWMRSGYFDDCQSRSHERVAETHEFRRRVGQPSSTAVLAVAVVASVGVMVLPPFQWLVRGGRRGVPANLGSDRVPHITT
jgi:hypothetical protein